MRRRAMWKHTAQGSPKRVARGGQNRAPSPQGEGWQTDKPSRTETRRCGCRSRDRRSLRTPRLQPCRAALARPQSAQTAVLARWRGALFFLCGSRGASTRSVASIRSENFRWGMLARERKNPRAKHGDAWARMKNFITIKPIFPKPLAKTKRMCYNISWVPVIRLYRGALFTSMQGRRSASTAACLFSALIIPQTEGFVNMY